MISSQFSPALNSRTHDIMPKSFLFLWILPICLLISICVGVGKKYNHTQIIYNMVYKSLELIYNEDLN